MGLLVGMAQLKSPALRTLAVFIQQEIKPGAPRTVWRNMSGDLLDRRALSRRWTVFCR